MTREKWSSEPDLWKRGRHKEMTKDVKTGGAKGWVSRHLSFKRKRTSQKSDELSSSLDEDQRSTSSPQLTIEVSSPPGSPKAIRRPSCIDGVVPLNIIPRRLAKKNIATISEGDDDEDVTASEPPTILKTDFDEELTNKAKQQGSDPPPETVIMTDTLGSKLNRSSDRFRRLKTT